RVWLAGERGDDGFRVGRLQNAPADTEQGQPAERAGLVRGQPQQHVRAGREADGVYWLAALDGRGHVGLDPLVTGWVGWLWRGAVAGQVDRDRLPAAVGE